MDIRVFKIISKTNVEGPNTRFCIWVQGCSLRCKGCGAPQTWDKEKGVLISVDDILEQIKLEKSIEGVTFLGGEPFEQAEALSLLAQKVQKLNLSVVTFTGYTMDELLSKNDIYINKLIQNTDILIDGPFQIDNIDFSRPWVGSSNQKYHFLTKRYSKQDILGIKNRVEVRVQKDGSIFFNGMGDFSELKKKLCEEKNSCIEEKR